MPKEAESNSVPVNVRIASILGTQLTQRDTGEWCTLGPKGRRGHVPRYHESTEYAMAALERYCFSDKVTKQYQCWRLDVKVVERRKVYSAAIGENGEVFDHSLAMAICWAIIVAEKSKDSVKHREASHASSKS